MNNRTQSRLIRESQKQRLKIITNSFYGLLPPNTTFVQYNEEQARRITEAGKEIISKLKGDNEEGDII